MRAIRRFTVRPVLPEPLRLLGDLALNLRWSWHPETQDVFETLDPQLWRSSGKDPVKTLGAVPTARLEELAKDKRFLRRLANAHSDLEEYLTGDRWFQRKAAHADAENPMPRAIAYFSPEFGITSVLPQYSGGLGILAGDHLKTASDLGIPLIGVGLLYQYGYFRQQFSREGWQLESYPLLDPDGLPITLLREQDGSPAQVRVAVPGGDQGDQDLVARVFVAQVGRVPLLLLDTDIEENPAHLREVTDRLYGGTTEHRLLQELLLGVGGVRAIRVHARLTGHPEPEVFHTNEGHAGFLGLERIRELTVDAAGPHLDFDTALEVTRAGTVFTTHTPVPAGIDRFPRDLVEQYFGGRSPVDGVPLDRILRLGAEDYAGGDRGVFNMAVMGFRLAQRANGVSELHGEVSRGMFNGLWPAFDEAEVPITSITNGVHAPTWVAREVFELAGKAGADTDSDSDDVWDVVDRIPGADLWSTKRDLRKRLVEEARVRLRKSCLARGMADAELGWVDTALDPDVLTIGFARRAASYKRLTLMLSDPERLKRLLLHPERPIQLIMAGKAHPADDGGKRLIQAIVALADDPEVRHRVAYLPNYDIAMAQPLYPGTDVWLNNPLRPYEACGTSGMKSALNGGLNLSILDGWWDEWYDGNNGWAIPSADGVEDPDQRDDIEAAALYDLLENEVAPRFYDVDAEGVPTRWLEMVRHTLKSLGPKVLSTRMLREYTNTLYSPAAVAARAMNHSYEGAAELAAWKQRVRSGWGEVRVDHVDSEGLADSPEIGGGLDLKVFVSLGALAPDDVEVQVVHGRVKGEDQLVDTTTTPLALAETLEGGRHRFDGHLALTRAGSFGYTVRVLPKNPSLASPAELGLVALA
ncbi:glycosyltransferase family 1 protein [Nocardioides korecus]